MGYKISILGDIQNFTGKDFKQPDLSCSFLEQGVGPEDLQTLLPVSFILWCNCCVHKKQGDIYNILNFDLYLSYYSLLLI